MIPVAWDNVLVLQTSFLGDTILTLPLITEIRSRFPVAKLTLLCTPLGRELLQDHPAIDELLVDDKKGVHRGWLGVKALAAELQRREFTVALTPHKSVRTAYLLYAAQIPNRIGFRQSQGWPLFHHRAERDPKRHDVERNLSILEPLGVKVAECQRRIELPLNSAMTAAVEQKLQALGMVSDKLTIGVSPGSVWPTKRWWSQGFGELVQLLKRKFDCQILLFGGNEDAAAVDQVMRRCGDAAINLVNKISLRELPAAISRCQVFVTNDSGPMHIAVARDVPTVAIFCATTPDLGFYPYSDNAVVLQRDLSCRPCTSHGGRRCPLGSEACIREITPEAVLQAVERVFAMDRERHRVGRGRYCPTIVAA